METEVHEGHTFINKHKSYQGVESVNMTYTKEQTLHEVVQTFRLYLLGCGFHPDSVEEYISAD